HRWTGGLGGAGIAAGGDAPRPSRTAAQAEVLLIVGRQNRERRSDVRDVGVGSLDRRGGLQDARSPGKLKLAVSRALDGHAAGKDTRIDSKMSRAALRGSIRVGE